MDLPRYRCHKEVRALKIKAVLNPNEGLLADDGERVLTFSDPGYESCAFVVTKDYMERHKPQAGGYYVVYDDGRYLSFSPAAPFEQGYTLIAPAATAPKTGGLSWGEALGHAHGAAKTIARAAWKLPNGKYGQVVKFGPHRPSLTVVRRDKDKVISAAAIIPKADIAAKDWLVLEESEA